MKSVLQAAWLLTVAIGNLVVVIVAEAKIFDSQAYEFFLFAGLMVVDMGIFAFMAMKYKYVEQPKEGDDEENMKTDSVPLSDKTINEKSGMDNTAYKNDE
ncbi:Peptide transporter family 1 [Blattella germanica]|nr:Peptide transporter family 1 [Blattella germanica]